MHLKRWITSVTILPFLILIVFRGGAFLFALLIGAVCVLALWEYFHIAFYDSRMRAVQGPLSFLGFPTGVLIVWAAYRNFFEAMAGLIALDLIFAGLICLPHFRSDSPVSEAVSKQVLGIVYIPVFLSYLVLIRNDPSGIFWIAFILVIIFAGDISAYYVGSYWGRRKLCPAVSPGKTLEGSIGGLAANLGVGALGKYFFLPLLPWGPSLVFFLSIGMAGQVGDLFESVLKRAAGVKDSGRILPGHGGILDRIDALIFVSPVAYYLKAYWL